MGRRKKESGIFANAVSAYSAQIKDIPILSREKEYVLAKKVKKGDKKARELLIKSNLRFVVKAANKYKGCGLLFADLVSAGNEGLIEACKRFDPNKGTRLITYAAHYIRKNILSSLAENGYVVSVTAHEVRLRYKVWMIAGEMESKLKRVPTDGELALRMGEPEKSVARSRQSREALSLNTPTHQDEEHSNRQDFMDLLVDESGGPPEAVFQKERQEQVMEAIEGLEDREAKIIRMRFGFGGEEMTLEKIGEELGVSRERVRQIEKKAKRKIGRRLKSFAD